MKNNRVIKILLSLLTVTITFACISAVSVFAEDATISVTAETFEKGSPITISYTGTSAADWIGIYPEGTLPGTDNPSLIWQYTADTAQPDGTLTFEGTLSAGIYDTFLLKDDGYEILAQASFTITDSSNQGGATLTLSSSEYTPGDTFTATYTGTSDLDWIGIYDGTRLPGDGTSIWWAYTNEYGQPDGVCDFTVGEGKALDTLEPGDYVAYLCKNDGYEVLAQSAFTILGDSTTDIVPLAPKALTYDRTAATPGFAAGVLKITPPEDRDVISHYAFYWGNDSGKLPGYSEIAKYAVSGFAIEFTFQKFAIIPEGATRILAYSYNGALESEEPASVDLPAAASPFITKGEPLFTFQVISDLHITSDSSGTFSKNLKKAFEDIIDQAPNSAGIFVNGDITDSGNIKEYQELKAIMDSFGEELPDMFFNHGNHDFWANFTDDLEQFKSFTGAPAVYYDKWVNGFHFIMLSSEVSGPNEATLSDTQLSWLESKLAEDYIKGKPSFVFLHQPMPETVAGTIGDQNWDGVVQAAQLKTILDKYPDAVMFNGHTHWEFQSVGNAFFDGPTIFNTASVGYLWTDLEEWKDGSQGYYIEVYKDKLVVKGRNFGTGTWHGAAQYSIEIKTSKFDWTLAGLIAAGAAVVALLGILIARVGKRSKK